MIICICGVKGKMATQVYQNLKDNYKIVGIDKENDDYIYSDYHKCFKENSIDVLIDFSTRQIACEVITHALKNHIKVISGTTNFTDNDIAKFAKLSKEFNTSLLISSNFSIGINSFYEILDILNKKFTNKHLIEAHHENKHDKPSGTAKKIAKILDINTADVKVFRLPKQNPMHEVYFVSDFEKVTIKHEILDYSAFVNGFIKTFDSFINENYFLKID